jgi:iron uptake system component EfeO
LFAVCKLARFAALTALMLAACSNSQKDAARKTEVTTGLKRMLIEQLDAWHLATRKLQDAAPEPSGRGWDPQQDRDAIAAMRAAWAEGRHAYELIEGAIAPMFPESDVATDARYEDHLLLVGGNGDPNPFDGEGVVGMHGIERILWADVMPVEVLDHEKNLPGYRPAAMPATEAEAAAFKRQLVGRLVADIETIRNELRPLDLDLAFAYRGLVDLVREQIEKVDKTSSGEEESRYAQATLRDLRANLQGCQNAWALFKPWLLDRSAGAELQAKITAGFTRLKELYDAHPGDAMPRPPASWSALEPTPADLRSPFGKLYAGVKRDCDEKVPGSLLFDLREAGRLLGLPEVF